MNTAVVLDPPANRRPIVLIPPTPTSSRPPNKTAYRPLAISLALAAVAGLTWKVATPKWQDSGKVASSLSAYYRWDGFHRTAIVDG